MSTYAAMIAMDRAFDALGHAQEQLTKAASDPEVSIALRNDLQVVASAVAAEAVVVHELIRRSYGGTCASDGDIQEG